MVIIRSLSIGILASLSIGVYDSYDDALAYLVQANDMQKPITENWIDGYKKWKSKK